MFEDLLMYSWTSSGQKFYIKQLALYKNLNSFPPGSEIILVAVWDGAKMAIACFTVQSIYSVIITLSCKNVIVI